MLAVETNTPNVRERVLDIRMRRVLAAGPIAGRAATAGALAGATPPRTRQYNTNRSTREHRPADTRDPSRGGRGETPHHIEQRNERDEIAAAIRRDAVDAATILKYYGAETQSFLVAENSRVPIARKVFNALKEGWRIVIPAAPIDTSNRDRQRQQAKLLDRLSLDDIALAQLSPDDQLKQRAEAQRADYASRHGIADPNDPRLTTSVLVQGLLRDHRIPTLDRLVQRTAAIQDAQSAAEQSSQILPSDYPAETGIMSGPAEARGAADMKLFLGTDGTLYRVDTPPNTAAPDYRRTRGSGRALAGQGPISRFIKAATGTLAPDYRQLVWQEESYNHGPLAKTRELRDTDDTIRATVNSINPDIAIDTWRDYLAVFVDNELGDLAPTPMPTVVTPIPPAGPGIAPPYAGSGPAGGGGLPPTPPPPALGI